MILVTSGQELAVHLLLPYGVLVLVGFLAQMVAGVSIRILPLFAWLREFSGADFEQLRPSPHSLGSRKLSGAGFALWTLGLPLLIMGLALDWIPGVILGGAALASAVAPSLMQLHRLVRPHQLTFVDFGKAPAD